MHIDQHIAFDFTIFVFSFFTLVTQPYSITQKHSLKIRKIIITEIAPLKKILHIKCTFELIGTYLQACQRSFLWNCFRNCHCKIEKRKKFIYVNFQFASTTCCLLLVIVKMSGSNWHLTSPIRKHPYTKCSTIENTFL